MALIDRKFDWEEYCNCWENRTRSTWLEVNGRTIPKWNKHCEKHPHCEMPNPHVHWHPSGDQVTPPVEPGYWNKPEILGETGWIRELRNVFVRSWKFDNAMSERVAQAREPDDRECFMCGCTFRTLDLRFTRCERCRVRFKAAPPGPYPIKCVGCGKEEDALFRRVKFCSACRRLRSL